MKNLNELNICIKGAGEMATAVAWHLFRSNIKKIVMLEIPKPLAVRRLVAFSEAIFNGKKAVQGVTAVSVTNIDEINTSWERSLIPIMVDPEWRLIQDIEFDIVIDSILAKKNLGTTKKEAPLVIGLGPGFTAGQDVHTIIETNRGHNLGKIVDFGTAEPNTSEPGNIGGYTVQRLLRAHVSGEFQAKKKICDHVKTSDIVGSINSEEIRAGIDGVIRGLIRSGINVKKGLKLGDIDPRSDQSYCNTISDKARNISGSVIEAVLRKYNK